MEIIAEILATITMIAVFIGFILALRWIFFHMPGGAIREEKRIYHFNEPERTIVIKGEIVNEAEKLPMPRLNRWQVGSGSQLQLGSGENRIIGRDE